MPFSAVPPTGVSPTQGPPGLSCVRSRAGDDVRVTLSGELDIAVVPQFDAALRRAEAESPSVILDLRRLEFMDCAAAGMLLAAHRRIGRAGGRLTVVPGTAEVAWFLTLIGMERQLEIVGHPTAASPTHG